MPDSAANRETYRAADLPFGPASAAEAARFALDHYLRSGVRLPAGNRLQMAHKLLSEIVRNKPTIQKSDLNVLERLRDAHVTALEHYMIATSVRPSDGPVGDEIRRKISQATMGTELESRDNDHLVS